MAQRRSRSAALGRRLGRRTPLRRAIVAGTVVAVLAVAGVAANALPADVTLERATTPEGATATPTDEASLDAGGSTDGVGDGSQGDSGSADAARVAGTAPTTLKVHIDGAVAAPGVYALTGEDLRVQDAVAAAGGLAADADTSQLNLAARLSDADKVHVPARDEVAQQASAAAAGTGQTSAAATQAAPSAATGLVNLNTATIEELVALPGVGEATARKIVSDRETNGPFANPEDLMRVSGIGEKKFAALADLVCV